MRYQSGSLNQPIVYALLAILVIAVYTRWDDIEAWFFVSPRSLLHEAARCGDFQNASPVDQAKFLEDCDCLEEAADDGAAIKISPDLIESCVREEVAKCLKDASLHQIYRACFASGSVSK